ncbi:zinc finger protein ush [Diaphorina citri]|uniref:Zinc finger protein ush n=1 Tax=Diaphorina citri TaxID=121845 RepID=A0A3Q0JPJ8_DIACI|nr:zinc finger protein ush [Diaphorina citri]
MSRQLQEFPFCFSVTAGEEDEEWSKNVAGEEEGSKEDRQSNDEKTSSPKPPSSKDETDPEASPAGYQSEDEPARRSSPVSDGARTDSGSEAKSPDLPKVRLNTNLATDPARNTPSARSASPRQSPTRSVRSGSEGKVSVKTERMVSPKTPIIPSPAELEYMASLQSLPTALQSAIAAGRLFFPGNADPRTKIDIPEVRQGPVYNDKGGDSDAEESTTPIKPPHTPSGEDTPSGGDGTRSPRIGKAHRCPHCSYSADKKVSLNRHMRMHSASPPTIATGPGPIPQNSNSSDVESDISSRHLVDRYCTDCDIRFSSLKTFRAHKLHYCSTRHVIKNVIGKPPSSPTSPTEAKLSPGGPGPSEPSQPFLALPTNPILIVPYSLFQNASILSGPVTMGLPSQDMACLLLPDGTLQPMAQGILNSSAPGSASSTQNKQRIATPSDVSQQVGPSEPSQPFLALPTNPILIVPYSLFQNASILSGPVTMGLPSQDMACLLLPDGTLQPMAQGILNSSAPGSAPSIQNKQRIATPSDVSQQAPKEVSPNSEPQATNMSSKPSSNNGHHPIKSSNMRNGTPGPLDLTTHRSGVEAGDMCEDEKENRRSVENHSVETEDIVCAPSIPLLLSTSSTCSSPSPAPISPCSNSSQKREGQSNSSSPRSGTSPPAKLRRPYNHMKMKEVEVKRRRMDSGSLSQPGFAPVGFDVPNLFLAAVAAQQDLKSDLPFPPELLPHLAASVSPRLSLPKNAKLPPGLLPGLQNLLPRGGAEIVNPATLLPMLNPELALRISAGELPNVSQTPPLVVKQGVSKCQECNIVFCKLENYLAHKKHYCSARQSAESSVKEESQPPTSQMKPSPSPPSPATSVSPKPTTPHLQFICTACGVKFMSYDSLTAHQTYYCNKKPIVPSSSSQDGSDKSNRKSPKFKNFGLEEISKERKLDMASVLWKEYCLKSSIHGLRYTVEPKRPLYERLIWTVLLIMAASFVLYQHWESWTFFSNSPTQIVVDNPRYPLEKVDYPAVTVCPINKSLYSKVLAVMAEMFGNVTEPDKEKFLNTMLALSLTGYPYYNYPLEFAASVNYSLFYLNPEDIENVMKKTDYFFRNSNFALYYCNKKPIVPSSSSQDGSDKSNRKSPKFKQELPGVGWKCPCCNVISTSTCAAQKHMESHKNVKAFLCKICSYKGNTLRGMRTHIRMHFETRSADVVEDNFITCLLDDPAVNNNNECTDISKPSLRQSIGENLNNNDIDMPPESINVNGIIRSNKKKFDDVTLDDEERRVENNIKKEVIDAEEYIDVDEDSDCHVENNCKLNPSSPNVENTLDLTRSNSESHVKFEPDVVARLQNEVSVKKENLGPENVRMEAESDEQSRYCTTCDITFNYASSLIAHKKFYCPKLKV